METRTSEDKLEAAKFLFEILTWPVSLLLGFMAILFDLKKNITS